MELFKDFKELIRSRSIDFVKARKPSSEHNPTRVLKFNWKGNEIYYRSGTSDRGLIYEVLVRSEKKAEYFVPDTIKPKVILDIGANVGVVSLWLAEKYPEATIFAFEPMPENVALLRRNTQHKPNIMVNDFGLSNEDKFVPVFRNLDTNNLGGFSVYRRENDTENAGNLDLIDFQMTLRNAASVLSELAINHVDLIKIDTEGSEFEILSALPDSILSKVSWLMGELHGRKTFETLARIDQWMSVGARKYRGSEIFTFQAINRNLLAARK